MSAAGAVAGFLIPRIEAEAPLDLDRLEAALSFAHPGPRPWPAKLTSAEFARVIAREYNALLASPAQPGERE